MIKINNLILKVTCVIIAAALLCGCSVTENNDIVSGEAETITGRDDNIFSKDSVINESTEDNKSTEEKENAENADGDSGSDSEVSDLAENGQSIIYVYVCGAVVNQGVYVLKSGSRAENALEAAGGFDENANRIYVNLAEILCDGERLYFPYEDEVMEGMFAEDSGADRTDVSESRTEDGISFPVNINTADVSQLCSIPGIGEAKAQTIIEYRENNGRFEYTQDITNVSGIGDTTYEKIAEYICVD